MIYDCIPTTWIHAYLIDYFGRFSTAVSDLLVTMKGIFEMFQSNTDFDNIDWQTVHARKDDILLPDHVLYCSNTFASSDVSLNRMTDVKVAYLDRLRKLQMEYNTLMRWVKGKNI
jgi:hypothetical protein